MWGRTLKPAPLMAMKIIIGRFDENGEPVWFEVESDDCKKGREADLDKVKGGDNDVLC